MPKLFNSMIGNDADPDVKRMALEAAERAHINQIYPDGASKQQWDAFSSPTTSTRLRDQTDTMDQGQPGQDDRRHAATALSRCRHANRL